MKTKALIDPDAQARIADACFARRGGRRGMTLCQAAKESGISMATLSRIETHSRRCMDISTLLLFCQWTKMSADYLLGIEFDNHGKVK